MYLPKQLQCLEDQTLRLFGGYIFRSSRPELFFKKMLLKILHNLRESTCAAVPFLIKFKAEGLKGVALWILPNFQERLFCKTPVNGC